MSYKVDPTNLLFTDLDAYPTIEGWSAATTARTTLLKRDLKGGA